MPIDPKEFMQSVNNGGNFIPQASASQTNASQSGLNLSNFSLNSGVFKANESATMQLSHSDDSSEE